MNIIYLNRFIKKEVINHMKRIGIGISDFKTIIEDDFYYVDKTMLIKELMNNGSQIILTPRPRRFGKTLNMSMANYFFNVNKKDTRKLFNGLAIEKEEKIMELQGEIPVVYISFKDVKYDTIEYSMRAISSLMSEVYGEHRYLLESNLLNEDDKKKFRMILSEKNDLVLLAESGKNLTSYLFKHFNKKVIVLMDEYDVPIQQGYLKGYYSEMISFERSFMGALLKDNENIEKALITGILRVAKESIFSGLNNLEVYSILDYEFNDRFGFTIDEVNCLAEHFDAKNELNEIAKWYNGYIFGDKIIYNPWSVLNYLKGERRIFKAYWINSSENALVKRILSKGDEELKKELQALINNEVIEKIIDENIVMGEIEDSSENIWSFLLMSGYLKSVKTETIRARKYCSLKIPNEEVHIFYEDMILKWFEESLTMLKYKTMVNALISGDIEIFSGFFKQFVLNNISYFDVSGKEPEKVYHAFVLGMLISLEGDYEVKSNKESGYGRYDVMIIPKDIEKLGIIMEFKKIDDFLEDTVMEGCAKALKQIEDKKYETELIEKGIKNIIKLAIVFKGKEIQITR